MTDERDFDEFDTSDSPAAPRANSEFDAQVKRKIRDLSSKDPVKRKEAAYWLGESGEPKAISALVQAYKQNKDKDLREAARYALGMFRALERALAGSDKEQQRALSLIENIVTKGQMGRRAPISSSTLMKLEIGLVASLVVLILLNLVAPSLKSARGSVIETPATQVADVNIPPATPAPLKALADVRTLLGQIRSDGSTLQLQLGAVQTGGQLDCAAPFSNPQPYTLPADLSAGFPQIVDLVGQLNAARTDLATAKAVFDKGCQPDAVLTAEEVIAPLETVTNMLRTLAGFEDQLNAVEASVQVLLTPTVPPATDTPQPTPTETPTPEPTATISPAVISDHIIGLDFIISQMTDLRGANTLLEQYWNDAQKAGVTDGCRPPYPQIADDYTLIDDVTATAAPKLKQAADLVNLGLAQVRQGWSIFSAACTNNTLASQAAVGLEFTKSAKDAFNAATALLDEVRAANR